jgi:hypothetical protein
MYEEVESFCLFLGYTRSGHSLVGTVLDAHPQTNIAHETEIFVTERGESPTGELRYADRDRMYRRLIGKATRSRRLGRRGFRRSEGPNPIIPNADNGQFTSLRVIGTSRAQENALIWNEHPDAFERLQKLVGVPLKFVHVYRSPWDNISSMMRVHESRAFLRFRRRVEIIQQFKERSGMPVHDVALEDLVTQPEQTIRDLIGFFDLDATPDYVAKCAAVFDAKPHASRAEQEWNEREVAAVRQMMRNAPWLARYPDSPNE